LIVESNNLAQSNLIVESHNLVQSTPKAPKKNKIIYDNV